MVDSRKGIIDRPGLYADFSPTGSGKTFAGIQAARDIEKTLTLVPVHLNAEEVAADGRAAGLDMEAYPRLDSDTCQNFRKAGRALACGMSPGETACIGCSWNETCAFRRQTAKADGAAHRLACIERGARGLTALVGDAGHIEIHEEPSGLLRPMVSFSSGLYEVSRACDEAIDGEYRRAEKPGARPFGQDLVDALNEVKETADALDDRLRSAATTAEIPLPPKTPKPQHLSLRLFHAWNMAKLAPHADAARLCRGMVFGELDRVMVVVEQRRSHLSRRIVGVWRNELPDVPMLLADASGNMESLRTLTGRDVLDITPAGSLPLCVPAKQITVDVTRKTSRNVVSAIVRGVLAEYPSKTRIGFIEHRPHVDHLFRCDSPALDQDRLDRVAMFAHYGEGPERSSNRWYRECDLIVVVGTPRVGESAVRDRLIQMGRIDAAMMTGEQAAWGPCQWRGHTESGETRTVQGVGYGQPDWRKAHKDIVRASLVQAVGRGRGILTDGVEVLVLSNEECGLMLDDRLDVPRISSNLAHVVEVVEKLHRVNAVDTGAIAGALGLCDRQARKCLVAAERQGLIVRSGRRGGWLPAQSA